MARPSKFTQKVADTICERLIGGDSLRRICAEKDMPCEKTVFSWLGQHAAFLQQYAHAREVQGEIYADRAVEEALSANDAQLGRLRMDALKWAAGKLAPKKFGEAVQLRHADANGDPLDFLMAEITSDGRPRPAGAE